MKKTTVLIVVLVVLVTTLGIAIPAIGNATKTACQEQFDEMERINEEFTDIFGIAGSTARINLGPMVAQLSDLKNEMRNLEVCDRLAHAQDLAVDAMDKGIDLFMAFMAEDPDITDEADAVLQAANTRNVETQAIQAELDDKSVWAWGIDAIF